MKDVGDFSVVAQEEIRQDLQAMLRGAIRAGLEVVLAAELERCIEPPVSLDTELG